MIRVAVVGSRDFANLDLVRMVVDRLGEGDGVIIISGDARGVDRTAQEEAASIGLVVEVYPAEWAIHGKSAGYVRNVDMVKRADKVIAFWDGQSKGTRFSIEQALKQQKRLEVFFA